MMSEKEWLASTNPVAMLKLFTRIGMPVISNRKLRLFAIAVARHGGYGSYSVEAVQSTVIAEQYADGLITAADMAAERARISPGLAATWPATWLLWSDTAAVVDNVLRHYRPDIKDGEASAIQAVLLRDIADNPWRHFRNCCFLDRKQMELVGACQLAHDIYQRRDWELLPVLADAVEDIHGTDGIETTLEHLRSPGLHTRECWALDYILDKS